VNVATKERGWHKEGGVCSPAHPLIEDLEGNEMIGKACGTANNLRHRSKIVQETASRDMRFCGRTVGESETDKHRQHTARSD
jgi:hypothetical protein